MQQLAETLQREADAVRHSILDCTPNRTHIVLVRGLKRLREKVFEVCKCINPSSTEELDSFKEAMHRAYVSIAEPFRMQQIYEIPFKIFFDMLQVAEDCSRIAEHRFDKGLEYANLSVAEVGLRNLDEGFSHMELAQAEDDMIGHKGVAKQNLQYIFDKAYATIDTLVAESPLSSLPKSSTICEPNLKWTEKCRLAKAVWKFNFRIRDNRSSLNNEDLERNLLNVCKVAENFLKRKFPRAPRKDQKLTPLISYAFRGKRDLYKEWDSVSKEYYDPLGDDERLIQILFDQSRSYLANAFLVLAIARNFSAHIFNDESNLFLETNYTKAFSMCIGALMYILGNVQSVLPVESQ